MDEIDRGIGIVDQDVLGGGILGEFADGVDEVIGQGTDMMEYVHDANEGVSQVYEIIQDPEDHYEDVLYGVSGYERNGRDRHLDEDVIAIDDPQAGAADIIDIDDNGRSAELVGSQTVIDGQH